MKYAKPYNDYSDLTTPVSANFQALAKLFNLKPKHLAFTILGYFADHPERLCLVSDDPTDARRD